MVVPNGHDICKMRGYIVHQAHYVVGKAALFSFMTSVCLAFGRLMPMNTTAPTITRPIIIMIVLI